MKKFLLFFSTFFIASALSAQSADFVTRMLESDRATFGQVCYLSAVSQNLVPESSKEVDALNAVFEQGLIPQDIQPGDYVNYRQASAIFAKMWNIKGGLFFRLTKGNPRYAYRQFKNDGVVPMTSDPSMVPSGTDVLNMFTMGEKKYAKTEGGSN